MTGGQARVPVTYLVPGSGSRDRLGRAALRPPVQPVRPRRGEDRRAGHPRRRLRPAGLARSATTTRWSCSPRRPRWACARTSTCARSPRCRSASAGCTGQGTDVTVVAIGHLVHDALAVAEELAGDDVGRGVRPAHRLPVRLGRRWPRRWTRTGRLVVVDDSNRTCGIGAEVLATAAEDSTCPPAGAGHPSRRRGAAVRPRARPRRPARPRQADDRHPQGAEQLTEAVMPLDPQVHAMRERALAAGAPPLYTLSVEEARAADLAAIQAGAGTGEPVHEVTDRLIPGPGGDLPIRVYRPSATGDALPTLVYFFGGGWTLGSLDTSDGICRSLANAVPCQVITVGYRLAPEHKFPAAVHDCHAAAVLDRRQRGRARHRPPSARGGRRQRGRQPRRRGDAARPRRRVARARGPDPRLPQHEPPRRHRIHARQRRPGCCSTAGPSPGTGATTSPPPRTGSTRWCPRRSPRT